MKKASPVLSKYEKQQAEVTNNGYYRRQNVSKVQ